MDNIEAKKIENGITINEINSAKKIKLSAFNEVIKNWSEVKGKNVNNDFDKMDVQPDLDTETNWNLVSVSEPVFLNNVSRPIRIMERGVEQARKSWSDYRQINNSIDKIDEVPTNIIDSDENEISVSNNLEDFGYTEDFSKAVEGVVEQPNFEPYNFEVPHFDEYEKDKVDTYEESQEDNYSEIERMVEEAIKNTKANSSIHEQNETTVEDNNYNIDNSLDGFEQSNNEISFSTDNLRINDLMMEIAQVYEANTNLEGNINAFNNRNNKMEKSINSINKETKDYEELSLKNAREILIKAREKQEMLRKQEEEAINLGKDLQERLINADEANLSAKKRNDYLSDMLRDNNYSESYEEESTYKKVA